MDITNIVISDNDILNIVETKKLDDSTRQKVKKRREQLAVAKAKELSITQEESFTPTEELYIIREQFVIAKEKN